MGARVSVQQDGENLVRTIRPPPTTTAEPRVQVQAQGVPNLIHELVHAVQAGQLTDDHGIDYTGIPFDLDTPAGRRVLWEELSCCLLSCAHLSAELTAAGALPGALRDPVDGWFLEQVEIQPVFYGMEAEPARFFARVAELLVEHRSEATAVVARARALLEAALLDGGATATIARVASEPLDVVWVRVIVPWAATAR